MFGFRKVSRQRRRRVRKYSSPLARLVAVLLALVAAVNVWGMPTGGLWHEEDGSLCPIGTNRLIPIDQMQFVTPAQERLVIERTQSDFIPDDGGLCYFISFDTAPKDAPPPVISPPHLVAEAAPLPCALRIPSPVVTDDVPAYYPHGPPLMPRGATGSVSPRAPPVRS